MCPNAIKRSNAFAEKQGLPNYEYVLHPRTTGFVHFVTEMKKGVLFCFPVGVFVDFNLCFQYLSFPFVTKCMAE